MQKHLAFLAVAVLLLAGCGKQGEVGRYTAPKEIPPDGIVAVGETQPDDRMLAALVPHGEQAWFFKLAGAQEGVSKQAETFEKFVQSVKFAKTADATPEWTLPEGWEEAKSNSQMRFATLKIKDTDPALEVSVAPLPWPPKNYVAMLHANVNRWRGQLQLKSIPADELPDQIREAKFADNDAIFVDLKGKLKPDAMQPPFAGGVASAAGEMPAGHPSMTGAKDAAVAAGESTTAGEPAKAEPAKSQTAKAEPPKATEKAKPAEKAAAAAQPKLPFEFEAPSDWAKVKTPQFAIAAFATKDPASAVDISVTPMMGPGGDPLMNINRWRAQLQLQPITAEELATAAPVFKIDGSEGKLVKLATPKEAGAGQAITAAMVKTGDTTWIFRMRGSAEAVEKQQENFEKFLSSIKFGPGEK